MTTKLFIVLVLLLVFHLLAVSSRKKPKSKPKFCKGLDGKRYKIGQSYKDDCSVFTCKRKGRKAIGISEIIVKNCCKYKGVVVPNGFNDVVSDGGVLKSVTCIDGKIKEDDIAVPPEEFFAEKNITIPGNATSDHIKLIHGACHSSHAIATDGLDFLKKGRSDVSQSLLEKLGVASQRILSEKNKWICGTSHMLSLIKDKNVREEAAKLLPQELQEGDVSESDEPDKRIIGGLPAGVGFIPWQALIMRVSPWGPTWGTMCGGVLIHSCYVLTARHCTAWLWNPSEQMSIILGDTNVPAPPVLPGTYSGPGQERQVMYVHYHPDPAYDVALILLKSSSSVNPSWLPRIKPIKIADFYPADDSEARASGFGSGSGSALNFAQIEVPSFTTCQNFWPTIGAPWMHLAAHEICAGGKNPYVGACHGDSGGPLTQADPVTGEQKLIGLVERGIGGCPSNMKYAIYVNPSFPAIKGWIDSILPEAEPTGNMGNANGTGKPCACLRPAVKYNGQPTNAYHFGNINNRNCLLKFLSSSSSCGTGSPNVPITIENAPSWTGFASPITCWANAGVPWSKDCSKQFPTNGKMYLEPWNPYDCPLELDPVPEYTHAYVASTVSGSWKGYYYGYAKQEFTTDVGLAAQAVCFSSLSMVTLSSGKMVSISQVKIGDYLQTADANGKLANSPFLGWLHKDQHTNSVFLNIITENNSFISLSPLHLILTTKSLDQKPTMKFANSVSVGDYLVSPLSESLLRVMSISQDLQKGVYAPLTETGTILVDGLVASCYAHIANHHLAHLGLLPVRLMPGLLEDTKSQNKDGMRTYLEYLMMFAKPFIIYTKDEPKVEEISLTTIVAGFLTSLTSV